VPSNSARLSAIASGDDAGAGGEGALVAAPVGEAIARKHTCGTWIADRGHCLRCALQRATMGLGYDFALAVNDKEKVMSTTRRAITWLLAMSLSYAGLMQGAQAALVGTEQVVAAQAEANAGPVQARLAELLQRDDVVAALQAHGVSPEQARARVAALGDHEAALLVEQIDAAPAGASDVLGVAVFIFVLLLITDILGFTKIFPFTRSIR
jgi:hypothetical protein